MKKKKVLVAAITSCFIVGSIIAWNYRSDEIPKLKIPEVGAETSIEKLEIDIPSKEIKELEKVKSVPIYKYVLPEKSDIVKLADRLHCDMSTTDYDPESKMEIAEGKNAKGDTLYFTYENGNGCWNWLNQTVQETTTGKQLPSDQQCQEIAVAKLKELGVYQDRFNTLHIEPETSLDDDANTITVAKSLFFYPEMDGEVVGGVSRIIVSIGDNGEVYEISKYYKDYIEIEKKEVISVNTALKKVEQRNAIFTLGETVEQANLNNAALTYWEDPGDIEEQSYLQPVWVFAGESQQVESSNAKFEAIVPALK